MGQQRDRDRQAEAQRRAAEQTGAAQPSTPDWLDEFMQLLQQSRAPRVQLWRTGEGVPGWGRSTTFRATIQATGWLVQITGHRDDSPDPPQSFSEAYLFASQGVWRVINLTSSRRIERTYDGTHIHKGAPSSFLSGDLVGGAPTEARAADATYQIKLGALHHGDDGVLTVDIGLVPD